MFNARSITDDDKKPQRPTFSDLNIVIPKVITHNLSVDRYSKNDGVPFTPNQAASQGFQNILLDAGRTQTISITVGGELLPEEKKDIISDEIEKYVEEKNQQSGAQSAYPSIAIVDSFLLEKLTSAGSEKLYELYNQGEIGIDVLFLTPFLMNLSPKESYTMGKVKSRTVDVSYDPASSTFSTKVMAMGFSAKKDLGQGELADDSNVLFSPTTAIGTDAIISPSEGGTFKIDRRIMTNDPNVALLFAYAYLDKIRKKEITPTLADLKEFVPFLRSTMDMDGATNSALMKAIKQIDIVHKMFLLLQIKEREVDSKKNAEVLSQFIWRERAVLQEKVNNLTQDSPSYFSFFTSSDSSIKTKKMEYEISQTLLAGLMDSFEKIDKNIADELLQSLESVPEDLYGIFLLVKALEFKIYDLQYDITNIKYSYQDALSQDQKEVFKQGTEVLSKLLKDLVNDEFGWTANSLKENYAKSKDKERFTTNVRDVLEKNVLHYQKLLNKQATKISAVEEQLKASTLKSSINRQGASGK